MKSGPNPKKIGRYIDSGADGHVFKYDKNKVIKFSFAFDENQFNTIKRVIKSTKRYLSVVDVYEFGKINDNVYYVIMEYLPHSISYADSSNAYYIYSNKLENFSPKILPLAKSLRKLKKNHKLVYDDIHEFNLRRTKNGRVKVIDLESFA